MSLPKYGWPVMPEPVRNPRVTYESWLAINFVPAEYHPELARRLDAVQEQAVRMAAEELRKAGFGEAADLIDPLSAGPVRPDEEPTP
jgi:hypothetical protein